MAIPKPLAQHKIQPPVEHYINRQLNKLLNMQVHSPH